jgi:hypothetical protein
MRIPLTVSSRPSDGTQFPSVLLRAGTWSFSSNIVDSDVRVNTPTGQQDLQGELQLTEKTGISLTCITAGKETSISVYACLSP